MADFQKFIVWCNDLEPYGWTFTFRITEPAGTVQDPALLRTNRYLRGRHAFVYQCRYEVIKFASLELDLPVFALEGIGY